MWIKRIYFQNFRNFQSLDLPAGQGFVVLTGPNGAGKTNLLEGIFWGATLRRFPDSKLYQMLKTGTDFYRVKIDFSEDQSLEMTAELVEEKQKYKLKAAGQGTTRTKYAGQLPVISFIPEDLNLLSHAPSGRRRFLNECLSGASAQYRNALGQYEKTLRQRNEALEKNKTAAAGASELEIWDEKLAEFGSQIITERAGLIEFFNLKLGVVLKALSADLADSQINYLPSGKRGKAEFLQAIAEIREVEKKLGRSAIGPHKDDFRIVLNGEDIVGYLSRGQQRALTLALKILERQYLQEKLKQAPIMLLDDVFSEFDAAHQKQLVEFLKTFEQVFLTTAHPEEIKKHLPADAQVHSIEDGHVQ